MIKRVASLSIAVSLILLGIGSSIGGSTAAAESLEREPHFLIEGEIVAPVELGSLTVTVYDWAGWDEHSRCDLSGLPDDFDDAYLLLDGSFVLPPGGGKIEWDVWSFGPYAVRVQESLDGTQRYFPPIGGDASRIGCFDEHLVSGQSGVDLGTLTLDAPALAGLHGSVIDDLGAPVGGARVRAVRLEPVELDEGIDPPTPGSAEWIETVLPDPKEWVSSDALGGFVLRGLSRGWYAVEVRTDGRLPFYIPGSIVLSEAEPVELVNPNDMIDVGTIDASVGEVWPESSANSDSWYDVVPGFQYQYEATPEDDPELWESFDTFEDMNEVSQIDRTALTTLSTPELLEAVLSYNFMDNPWYYNTAQEGMDAVIGHFNGLEELLSRPAAGQVLLDFYSSVDLEDVMASDHVGTLRFSFLELIIAQDQILSSLGAQGRVELMDALAQKEAAKMALPEQPLNGGDGALIAARIIQMDHPELLLDIDNAEAQIASGFFVDSFVDSLMSAIAGYASLEGVSVTPLAISTNHIS